MKVLNLDGEYFLYPENIMNIDEFASYLNKEDAKFIKLKHLFETQCVHPYYIFEHIKEAYVNIRELSEFHEDEIVLMNEKEYERVFKNVSNKLCNNCTEKEDCLNSIKNEYREKLCLDGSCFDYCEE